jgi:hypothetical protein
MTRRVGLNALALITILYIYGIAGVLYTLVDPGVTAVLEWFADPITLEILGWEGIVAFLVLAAYIVVGYYHSYRNIYKRPFEISYWIFLAILAFFFINTTVLPSTGEFTSFQAYYINYFGWYEGYFVRFNIEVLYGFNRLGVIQVFAAMNLILSLTTGRIKL